jgi:hypothetical protein
MNVDWSGRVNCRGLSSFLDQNVSCARRGETKQRSCYWFNLHFNSLRPKLVVLLKLLALGMGQRSFPLTNPVTAAFPPTNYRSLSRFSTHCCGTFPINLGQAILAGDILGTLVGMFVAPDEMFERVWKETGL